MTNTGTKTFTFNGTDLDNPFLCRLQTKQTYTTLIDNDNAPDLELF